MPPDNSVHATRRGFTARADPKDIWNYRCATPPDGEYMMTFPVDNIWGLPAGTYGPSVDDGVYLMLAPLTPGPHTIHFTSASSDGSFALDVTYNLTVKGP